MARKQARRSSASGGLTGFLAGLICGLGLAALAWVGGYMPRGDQEPVTATTPSGRDEPPIIEGQPDAAERNRQYEFFTVLPEIEVVVPTQEIEQRARETEQRQQQARQTTSQQADSTSNAPVSGNQNYMIQVGSFRNGRDAEALKARLAMLGQVASVQTVNVDGSTMHRVRLGPFNASQANRTRQQLQDGGFESMILSAN
ncbi:MAG: SPOR domain-containing protein [Pseudomonadota bacterium]